MIHTETLTNARKSLCDCEKATDLFHKLPSVAQLGSDLTKCSWASVLDRHGCSVSHAADYDVNEFKLIWRDMDMIWFFLFFMKTRGFKKVLVLDLDTPLWLFFTVSSWSIHGTVQTWNHRKQMQSIRFHFHMWRSAMMSRAVTCCLASSRVNNIVQNFLFLVLPQFPLHVTTADSSCHSAWSGFLYG